MQLEFFQLDRLKRLIKCQISTTYIQKKEKTEKTQKKIISKGFLLKSLSAYRKPFQGLNYFMFIIFYDT